MSKDTVKLFQRARAALQSEKDSLSKALANAQATAADAEKRLAEIEAALGGAGTAPAKRRGRKPKKAAGKRRGRPAKKTAAKRGRPAKKKAAAKRKTVKKKAAKKVAKKVAKKAPKKKAAPKQAKNERSLKDFVLQETKNKTLKLAEIAVAVQKAGYKSKSKNLKNSIAASVLYNSKNKELFKKSKDGFTAA